jgi:hypothetical protein
MNFVGIAYFPDGAIAARFSDTVKVAFNDKERVDAFTEKTFYYKRQFEIAPGTYNLKLMFSSAADSFGKLETDLFIDPWKSKQFSLSDIALSRDLSPVASVGVQMMVIDAKSGKPVRDHGLLRIDSPPRPDNPAVPDGMKLPLAALVPGDYRLQLNAIDVAGAQYTRAVDFTVE